MWVELLTMNGCGNAGQVGRSVGVCKSELDVATLLLGYLNPNVDRRIEYIDLRIRNVDFDMRETEAFLLAVYPHSLSLSFVQHVYPAGWPAQSHVSRTYSNTNHFIAFRQFALKLDFYLHGHLDNRLEPNGNRGWIKTLNLYVFSQVQLHTIQSEPQDPFAGFLIAQVHGRNQIAWTNAIELVRTTGENHFNLAGRIVTD